MVNVLKTEIKRSLFNKRFLLSLLISMVLVIWYSISRLPFCVEKNLTFSTNLVHDDFLEISFTNWIGSHNIFLQQNIFYLILPILATLPFGGSLFSDINGGYIKSICTRVKKSNYLVAKYIAVFVSGGSAVVMPMLFSFVLSSAFLPTMLPEASYAYTNIASLHKWAGLFFTYPFLYLLLYLALTFVFAGLTACMALAVSYFSYKSFLTLIFPFFVYIFSSLFCELVNLQGFSVRNLLTTTGEYSTTFSSLFMMLLFFVLSFFPYYLVGVKKDVL